MKSEAELYNLDAFDWAEVDPKTPVTDATKQDDVLVKVHERKRNSIQFGFGFEVINRGGSVPSGTVLVPGIPPVGLPNEFKTSQQTFWGPRGLFEYTRRNVRGRGESYTVTGYAATLDQRAGFTYTDPYFRGTIWKGSALVSVEHNAQNPIFTARLANVGYQLERALNAKKTTNLFLRYNFQINRISDLLIPELVPPNQLNVQAVHFVSQLHPRHPRQCARRSPRLVRERGVRRQPVVARLELQLCQVSGTSRALQEHRPRNHLGQQSARGLGAALRRQRGPGQPEVLHRRRQHVTRIPSERRRSAGGPYPPAAFPTIPPPASRSPSRRAATSCSSSTRSCVSRWIPSRKDWESWLSMTAAMFFPRSDFTISPRFTPIP